MDLEGIMLSMVQRKTDTVWSHLHVESKTKQNQNWAHSYREQIGGSIGGVGWVEDGVQNGWRALNKYTLPAIK